MQLKVLMFTLIALFTGTMITVSSNHWFLAWIGLEINTLAITPLIMMNKTPRATEATTKYFIIQASASATLLCLTMFNYWKMGEWNINFLHPTSTALIMISLVMKLGIAPLHFWMPEVLQGTSFKTGLILATWQKIAPLILLYQISTELNTTTTTTLGFISVLVGGWGIMNQTELRKMLAYSSIGHLGWMIIILPYYPNLALLNFIIYVVMSTMMFLTLNKTMQTKISHLSVSWSYSPPLLCMITITLMSLGGLLPLTGFLPKLLTVFYLTKKSMIIITTLLITASLLSMYMYIRLTHFTVMMLTPHTTNSLVSWRPKKTLLFLLPLSTTISILLMPILPTTLIMLN